MTLARMAAIPVTIDRRNQPPMPREEFMRGELLSLGRQIGFCVYCASVLAIVAAVAYLKGATMKTDD
jgi:hypothetical protein